MAVNYFGHFLLTNLLLDLLKQSAPSRIINVSSALAKLIPNLDLTKLNEQGTGYKLYAKTKLCNILFTQELAKKLEGTGVTTYSLHPGVVKTEFNRKVSAFTRYIVGNFQINSEQGTQTTLHVSLEDGLEELSGQHFANCKRVKPYCGAKNPKKAEELWEINKKLVKLTN